MRKSITYIKALALASLVFFSGCEEDEPQVAPRVQTINASIESDQTRVSLSEQDSSRDLLATNSAYSFLETNIVKSEKFRLKQSFQTGKDVHSLTTSRNHSSTPWTDIALSASHLTTSQYCKILAN